MVSKRDIKIQHTDLKKEITYHNDKYHVDDAPEISDREYDLLFKKLKELESKHSFLDVSDSPTNQVGGVKLSELKEFVHELPMLSLDNAFDLQDLFDFEKRNINRLKDMVLFDYIVEPKIDGIAISLLYEDGVLKKAGTRGDGAIGEDVTHNVLTIKGIPTKLSSENGKIPKKIEIRGEIFIKISDFKSLNNTLKKSNQKVFANPRNFVAGSVRQLDSSIASKRPLNIYCHSVGLISERSFFETQADMVQTFQGWGLPTSDDYKLCKNIEEVNNYVSLLTTKRDELDYEIDGIVIKVNDKSLQNMLGASSRSPRWAIAKKFAAEEGESKIISISFQMGRTGALTPVANLEPVKIGGVTISNATLHNMDEVKRLDVRQNDYVKIIRAGDVIPKVTAVLINERKAAAKKVLPPSHCPTCKEPISFFESNTPMLDCNKLKTTDQKCFGFSQFKETLKHFVSRNAMDIEGLGQRTIDVFVEKGFLKSVTDLYKLSKSQIIDLEGFASKSTDKLLDSINSSLTTDLHRFVYALGIKEIGLETSKNLSKYFNNLTSIQTAKYDDFIQVDDVGEVAATNLENFFSNIDNKKIINEFLKLGLKLNHQNKSKPSHLTNKVIVITGKLSNYSREDLKGRLELMGAKVTNSVSAKTDFLIAGEDSGSKLSKANKLNIKIISDENLESFIDKT